MAFEKVIRLIEQANEMESTMTLLDEWGTDYCEPDELEDRQDKAYTDHFNSCMELARHLRKMMGDECDLPTAREMAFDWKRRNQLLDIFTANKK